MTTLKKIVEVIHPNTAMRTFATTVNIPGVDSYVSLYGMGKGDVPEAAKGIVAALWEIPATKGISLSRGEIRVEVSDAWEEEWAHVSPSILKIVNDALFDGKATCTVRDDAAKAKEAEKRQRSYGYGA